jgi:hypothetical protein
VLKFKKKFWGQRVKDFSSHAARNGKIIICPKYIKVLRLGYSSPYSALLWAGSSKFEPQ